MVKTILVIMFILMLEGAFEAYYDDREKGKLACFVSECFTLAILSSFTVLAMQWLLIIIF